MKSFIFCLFCAGALLMVHGCNPRQEPDNIHAEIDSLKSLTEELKPGLGEFMLLIRAHHDSLGRAIGLKDFERAAYEVDEIKETAEKVKKLNITNDKLQHPFAELYKKWLESPLQTLADAASKKNEQVLKNNFISLTNNCNGCHYENNMPFMKIGY